VKLQKLKNTTRQRLIIYPIVLVIIAYILWPQVQAKYFDNGFDLSDSLINKEEIYHGGPPKDGIPSLDKPMFIHAKSVKYLNPKDRVLGLKINGIIKAYPIKILDHHEVVNDTFWKQSVVISYCPLCGTGMAFDATIDNKNLEFGVSGLLYNSDVLLYDRNTKSLWSQILSQAISGPLKGQKLELLSLDHTSWKDWSQRFPETLVLSDKTGFNRNYQQSPYSGYENSQQIYFPIKNLDKRYHPKELVVALKIDNKSYVFPFAELSKSNGMIEIVVNKKRIRVQYDPINNTATVYDSNKQVIPSIISYWFAWMAFYPDSILYEAD
jgi:hypothetical protein